MTSTVQPLQQPAWPDVVELDVVKGRLAGLPSVVPYEECELLVDRISEVQRGAAFILQGGDCAETFDTVTEEYVLGKLKVLLQMQLVLMYATGTPVVKIGRMAGQYGKPRSSDTESRDGVTLPSYRGDAVNSAIFSERERTPLPSRMLDAYNASSATMNVIRGFMTPRRTNVNTVCSWNSEFLSHSAANDRYRYLQYEVGRALSFLQASRVHPSAVDLTETFVSHEALLLDYEQPLVRPSTGIRTKYGSSGHMLWIGERTRDVDGAHVRLLSELDNPVGVKVGPGCTPWTLIELLHALNPKNVPGRVTVITRMGVDRVGTTLPGLIHAVERANLKVAWSCDPMHGNTRTTAGGYKTRRFEDVADEIIEFFRAHRDGGTWPGGIHLELSGEDVTECTGGAEQLGDDSLGERYMTTCDPRLNRSQAIELAFLVAEELRRSR